VQLGRRELRYFGRLWIAFCQHRDCQAFTFVEQLIGAAVAANPQNFIIAAEFSYVLARPMSWRIGLAFAALSVDLPSVSAGPGMHEGQRVSPGAIYLLAAAGWLL